MEMERKYMTEAQAAIQLERDLEKKGFFTTDDMKYCDTDNFLLTMDPELQYMMDWDTMLPRGFMIMSLLNSIIAIALSKEVVDDWHWKPVQQQHLIRRLEKPDFDIGEKERVIVWAAVLWYQANEVGDWMIGHGFPGADIIPSDTSEWAPWVTRNLKLEYGAEFGELSFPSLVKGMKTRGYIQ